MKKQKHQFLRLQSIYKIFAMSLCAALAIISLPSQAITTSNMTTARIWHSANALPDGKVLITGGKTVAGATSLNTTEVFDPATRLFSPSAPMLVARSEHNSITLKDGRILAIGGQTVINGSMQEYTSAEIFDPVAGTWTATGNMNAGRARSTAVLLQDGRVLIIGSVGSQGQYYAETYDPVSGIFTKTGYVNYITSGHGLVALADGRVLKMGGYGTPSSSTSYNYLNGAEVWDPATNNWTITGSMRETREYLKPVLLENGNVLVAGGRNNGFSNTTEIYNPVQGSFSYGANLPTSFVPVTSVSLNDGSILYTADYDANVLRYNSITNQWNLTGPKRVSVHGMSVTKLATGDLLFAGGTELNDGTANASLFNRGCVSQQNFISLVSQSIPDAGGNVNVDVNVAASCEFDVGSLPSWITLVTQSPLIGSLTLTLNVQANSDAARNATFYIADRAFQISQAGSCPANAVATLSPASKVFSSSNASSGSITVTHNSECSWTVTNIPTWVTITSGASGKGNGVINYTITANTTSTQRNATLNVGNSSATISQVGVSSCPSAPVISQTTFNFQSGATTGSISVTAAASCFWSFSGLPSWMTITSGATGAGNGTAFYSVQANTGAARSASAQISSSSFASSLNIFQAATQIVNCNAVALTSGGTYQGTLDASGCNTGARGANYYTNRFSFNGVPGKAVSIQLTSSAFDTYVYLRNPSGTVIKSDDDGGGGTNSRIPATSGTYILPAGSSGTYIIEVTSYYANYTGAYSLTFTQF